MSHESYPNEWGRAGYDVYGAAAGDRIRIENLEVRAFHGVLPEEKVLGQKFLLSIEMGMDLGVAGRSDDLTHSVSYAEVAHAVTEFFRSARYDLIETGAEAVARLILLQWPLVRRVAVCVKKPWAPVGLPLDTVSVTVRRAWHRAYIALGANLGDPQETFRTALAALTAEDVRLRKTSSFHRTKPVGFVDQPEFLNGACEVETLLDPHSLLRRLHEVEALHGRTRDVHWGPRTLDLDLLMYDDLVTECPDLVVPHPRMLERRFVLVPLVEIAPWARHPIAGLRLMDALAVLGES